MRPVAALWAAALGAGALLLGGCQQLSDLLGITDPWARYTDSNENFIAASPLDPTKIDETTAGYNSPAVWTWAWRGDSDASDSTGFKYMGLTKNSSLSPPSSVPAASVYDLELYNLYPNDEGDFESSGSLPVEWSLASGSATGSTFAIQSAGLQIHGLQSIKFDTDSGGYAAFSLAASSDNNASNAVPHTYVWRSYMSSGSTYVYQIGTTFDATKQSNSTTIPALSDQKIDFITVAPSSTERLIFGSSSPLSFELDDTRLIRQDIVDHLALRLLLRPGDAAHTLRSGYYEFTIWVKKPAGATFLSEAGAKMHYAASRLTLRMLSLSFDKGNQALHVFPIDGSADADGGIYDSAAGWVKLSLRMKNGGNFYLDSESPNPVMELAIYPFDSANPDAGQVEISDPELHYYKDGY